MRILFVGDVVGRTGRAAIAEHLVRIVYKLIEVGRGLVFLCPQ